MCIVILDRGNHSCTCADDTHITVSLYGSAQGSETVQKFTYSAECILLYLAIDCFPSGLGLSVCC